MQNQAHKTFVGYLKEHAYWLGFKSPRWTLFIAGVLALSRGLFDFIFVELLIAGVLYYFYRKHTSKH